MFLKNDLILFMITALERSLLTKYEGLNLTDWNTFYPSPRKGFAKQNLHYDGSPHVHTYLYKIFVRINVDPSTYKEISCSAELEYLSNSRQGYKNLFVEANLFTMKVAGCFAYT